MAGSSADFSAADFNAAIRSAMQMAAPIAESDRAAFYFKATGTATHRSADDVPWDPAVVQDRVAKAPVIVDCGVEYAEASDQDTHLGPLRPTRIKVTLLESDYQQVVGCSHVVYGGKEYAYRRTEVGALFDAGVYVMHFTGAP